MSLMVGTASCASLGSGKPIDIQSVSIRNEGSFPVSNIHISVQNIPRTLNASQVPGGAEMSYGFPVREYQGSPLTIRWTRQGRTYESRNLLAKHTDPLPKDTRMNALIVLENGTRAALSLEPVSALEARLRAAKSRSR